MNVLLLNGSPARPSHTSSTLTEISGLFEGHDYTCETIDLIDYQIATNDPVYHEDAMKSPDEKVRDFATKVRNADIVVLGTPLYHGSFSGLLKTALDNLDDDAFRGKRVLLASNAAGIRVSMQAAHQLSTVARTLYGTVFHRFIGTTKSDFELDGDSFRLTSEDIKSRCKEIVDELCTTK